MSLEDYLSTREALHKATEQLNGLRRTAALSRDFSDLKERERHLTDAIEWHKMALATMRQEIEQELLHQLQRQEAAKQAERQALQREMVFEAGIAGTELTAALDSLDSVGDLFCSSLAGMIRDSYGKAAAAHPGPTARAFGDSLAAQQAVEQSLFQRLIAIKPAADLEQAARIQFDRLAGE